MITASENKMSPKAAKASVGTFATAKIVNDSALESGSQAEFHFDAYATTLARILLSKGTAAPLVIGIYGKWGTGKTTLLKILRSKLNEHNVGNKTASPSFLIPAESSDFRVCKTVWFNAWKYAREEDLYVALVQRIGREMSRDKSFVERIRSKAQEVVRRYNWPEASANLLSQALSQGRVSLDLQQYRETDLFSRLVFYDEFQTLFDELVFDFVNGHEGGVLVILIDDLDRCLPSKIIQVLEGIKQFTDTGNCVFVIAADHEIVASAVRAHYAAHGMNEINPHEYMDKIVQVRFELPPLRVGDAARFVGQLAGEQVPGEKVLRLLVRSIPTNPRRIKRFVNHLEMQWAIMVNTGLAKNARKNDLVEWLALGQACPSFCQEVTQLESDHDKVRFIAEAREFARGNRNVENLDSRVRRFCDDAMFMGILKEGAFRFSPATIGLYIHLSPAPSLRLAPVYDPKEIINTVLGTLPPHEQRAIRLRYGLDDGQMRTLTYIAQQLNVTPKTIGRWIRKSLYKLKHPTRSRGLREAFEARQPLPTGHQRFLEAALGMMMYQDLQDKEG